MALDAAGGSQELTDLTFQDGDFAEDRVYGCVVTTSEVVSIENATHTLQLAWRGVDGEGPLQALYEDENKTFGVPMLHWNISVNNDTNADATIAYADATIAYADATNASANDTNASADATNAPMDSSGRSNLNRARLVVTWRGTDGDGPLREPNASLVSIAWSLAWSPLNPSECLQPSADVASALAGGRRMTAEERRQEQQEPRPVGVFLAGPCPVTVTTTTTTSTTTATTATIDCVGLNITCNDFVAATGPQFNQTDNLSNASNNSNLTTLTTTTTTTTTAVLDPPVELSCGVSMGKATHFLMSIGNGTEEVRSFFKILDETGSPPRSRPRAVTFTDNDPDAAQIAGTLYVSVKKPEPLDIKYYRLYLQAEDGQYVSNPRALRSGNGSGPTWLAEMPATGFDFSVVLAKDFPVPTNVNKIVAVAGNAHGEAEIGRSMRLFDTAPEVPPERSLHFTLLLAFGIGVFFICCCTVSTMCCIRFRRFWRRRMQERQEEEAAKAKKRARDARRAAGEDIGFCDITEPSVEEIFMLDPRPKPDDQEEVGIVAFAGDESACDGLCTATFLSNDFDCGPCSFMVEAPEDQGVIGHKLAETRCSTATEAIQFWRDEDGSETEYTGKLANEWEAMLLILKSKFSGGLLEEALLQTGDTFLLHHNLVVGDDMIWADNGDGQGLNWLGIQLMLVRDELAGVSRWTKYLKGLININCGEAWSTFQAEKWRAVVKDAHASLEDALHGEYVDI